jgi:Glycosyl hydrolases family 18
MWVHAVALLAVLALLVIVAVAVVRGWRAARRPRRAATGATGWVDGSTLGGPMIPKHLLGTTVPFKAVYIGYAAGVSAIDATVEAAASAGFNLIILAFWMGPGVGADPYSALWYWQQLSQGARNAAITFVHNLGARVMLSAGGAGYTAYPHDGAAAFGQGAANLALGLGLDGVDFDMENLTNAFGTPSGLDKAQTIQWLTDATSAAASILGGSRIVTHAPQAPYFNQEFAYGYLQFMLQSTSNQIYAAVQYYNQGGAAPGGAYGTYDEQFIANPNYHPGTAIAELVAAGLPVEKLIIGRLTQPGDGDPNTWISPSTLGQWFAEAATDPQTNNWMTGFSTWQWHQNGDGTPSSPAFLAAVYP